MLTYFEKRIRYPSIEVGDVYKVRTWLLFGVLPIFRSYEQLTVSSIFATPGEKS